MRKVKVGIIGCGNISKVYMKNCRDFALLDLTACADLYPDRAKSRAEEFQIPKACTVDELLADPEIEIVINLTVPMAHAAVSLLALKAGKHVHVEKPLAVTLEDGREILETAASKGLLIGSAPDTFLGGGIQTCRKLIDDGWIGTPVAATAFMLSKGPEGWHPDPAFFYHVGGGPMFDIGPYYLSTLIHLLGPIRRVTGATAISFPERTIKSPAKYGEIIKVEVPTHITGLLDFHSGAVGTIITSFDVLAGTDLPRIEIYGSKGTLRVPDPNTFGGPVLLRQAGVPEWKETPLTHGFTDNSRGLAVLDMAYALRNGRPHRASGELGYHVLEAMHGFHVASTDGRHYTMTSSCNRPDPLPLHITDNKLDI